jgi:hypothetical protein
MIRAFATRTASALADGFSESVFVPAPAVDIMSNGVGAFELSATGCTLIGPVDVGLRLGIMDNAYRPSWFESPYEPSA